MLQNVSILFSYCINALNDKSTCQSNSVLSVTIIITTVSISLSPFMVLVDDVDTPVCTARDIHQSIHLPPMDLLCEVTADTNIVSPLQGDVLGEFSWEMDIPTKLTFF